MYSIVRISERGGRLAADVSEVARSRVEALGSAAGFVTLLAIKGDDGALITVEIFETLDDMRGAQVTAGRDVRLPPDQGRPGSGRTITGEIVFQRGL